MAQEARAPLVVGFESSHTATPLLLMEFQRWCYGRNNPSKVGSGWAYCGSYGLRMSEMKLTRSDDGSAARHSHEGQALILLSVHDVDGQCYPVVSVVDTKVHGLPRAAGEPAPVVPDQDGFMRAVGDWVNGRFPAALPLVPPPAPYPHPEDHTGV